MTAVNPLAPGESSGQADAVSWWWPRACRAYDRFALRAAGRSVPHSIRAADRLGRLAHTCRIQGPTSREVTELFEGLPAAEAVRVAREIAALRFKNRTAVAIVLASGRESLAPLVTKVAGVERLRRFAKRREPALLATWHVGAEFGVSAGLLSAGINAMVLRDLPLQTDEARTLTLKRGLDHLRAGGTVIAVLDGPLGSSTGQLTCLGRSIVFRRGAFMLARVTGAPLVPVVARWESDGSLAVTVDSPVAAPVFTGAKDTVEDAHAQAVADWLSDYLRQSPEEIWPFTLRNFLQSPATPQPTW